MGLKNRHAFAELLGDGPYLPGYQPTSCDTCALGVIGNVRDGPLISLMRDTIRNTRNIAGNIDHLRQEYFADVQKPRNQHNLLTYTLGNGLN